MLRVRTVSRGLRGEMSKGERRVDEIPVAHQSTLQLSGVHTTGSFRPKVLATATWRGEKKFS